MKKTEKLKPVPFWSSGMTLQVAESIARDYDTTLTKALDVFGEEIQNTIIKIVHITQESRLKMSDTERRKTK